LTPRAARPRSGRARRRAAAPLDLKTAEFGNAIASSFSDSPTCGWLGLLACEAHSRLVVRWARDVEAEVGGHLVDGTVLTRGQ
jgi:hypothetical protein